MDWKTYFEERSGTGVLATADADGKVNAAIYARPHVLDDGLGFIMPDRRTHQNLVANPRATYLFMESPAEGGERYAGTRLYLRKVAEERGTERLRALRRRKTGEDSSPRYLVLFEIEENRPLVGDAA